jgi:hypothetical protein
MSWRVAKSILTLHEQLRRGAPAAAPPATPADSWGTIGDILHDTTSDHVPHDFAGWGDNIVTAGDFPNRPDLGLDAHRVLDDIRRSKDARAKYGISNDQIFSNHAVTQDGRLYPAWTWRPYLPHDAGRDRHYDHGHLSVVGDARADGQQPWQTIGAPPAAAGPDSSEDEDMGQSTPPININTWDPEDGPGSVTSLSIPPVQAGTADPRPAWFNATNDTNGEQYGLRVWYGSGVAGDWKPLGPGSKDQGAGLYLLGSGERLSISLPKGAVCVTVGRMSISQGRLLAPAGEKPPYNGHLTCCFERGTVGSTG